MRVGVNARALTKPNPAGVSRYTRELLSALGKRADAGMDDAEYLLFGVEEVPDELGALHAIRSANEPAPVHSGLRAHLWEQFHLPRALRKSDLDVFHTPAGNPPVLAGTPLVTTIHDISPVTHPDWFSTGYAALYRAVTPLAVHRSDRLIAVSAFTRAEVLDVYPGVGSKTTIVHNGISDPPVPDETKAIEGLDEFLLFVGSSNPRKNLTGLLSAYDHYRRIESDPLPLVLVGPDREIFADRDYRTLEGVRTRGYVPDAELAWLYRHATVFVYPARYEGFGLPILEAMRVGTPVVTSDRGATKEVAGTAARLVDPDRPTDIAHGIADAVSTRATLATRGQERAAEFTWERTAAHTADVYRDVAHEPVSRNVGAPPVH